MVKCAASLEKWKSISLSNPPPYVTTSIVFTTIRDKWKLFVRKNLTNQTWQIEMLHSHKFAIAAALQTNFQITALIVCLRL